MNTGARIRHYRQKLGWTLDDLEDESGVPAGTISALELRDSKKSQFFPALAKAFGLTLEQLHDSGTDWPVIDTRKVMAPSQLNRTNSPADHVADDDSRIRDYYNAEIAEIVLKIPTTDMRGAVAVLRSYVQNLSPPNDGQTLSMAA